MKKGEITVFLSLTVVLLVSFILGMMNAANIQLMKNQARIDVDSALYSLFGEYQTDLLEEYHIFGIEETYGTGNLQEENLLRRMHYFGTKGIVHEIKGIQYLILMAWDYGSRSLHIWNRNTGLSMHVIWQV